MEYPQVNDNTLAAGFNFTPWSNALKCQVRMRVEWTQGGARQRKGLLGVVTDLDTAKQYKVYGRACGLQCYCDARIQEIKK